MASKRRPLGEGIVERQNDRLAPDVRFWHKADITEPPINVRFRG